jgi:DNA-binding SARP family transcriptional activator
LPVSTDTQSSDEAEKQPPMVVRCFGRFEIIVDGKPLDLATLKPRARQALRFLALHAGGSVHREVMTAIFWPDLGPEAARRNLQVVISSLRRVLEHDGGEAAGPRISRDGETYRLDVPAHGKVDLLEFDRAISHARAARARGDVDVSMAAYTHALDLHGVGLLPEDGPAEWVVAERDQRHTRACEATRCLAEMHLSQEDPASAAAVTQRGIWLDRYRDEFWRLRIIACERAGDVAAAARARRDYEQVLSELGIPGSDWLDADQGRNGDGVSGETKSRSPHSGQAR